MTNEMQGLLDECLAHIDGYMIVNVPIVGDDQARELEKVRGEYSALQKAYCRLLRDFEVLAEQCQEMSEEIFELKLADSYDWELDLE